MQNVWRSTATCFAMIAVVSLAFVSCKSKYDQHYDKAKSLKSEGRHKEAIAEYMLAAKADPKKARPLYRAAQVCMETDRRTSAVQLLFKAIAIEPDYDSLYPNLVKALTLAEQFDRAKAEGLKALELEVIKSDITMVEEIKDLLEKVDSAQQEAKKKKTDPTTNKPPTVPGTQ